MNETSLLIIIMIKEEEKRRNNQNQILSGVSPHSPADAEDVYLKVDRSLFVA